VRRLTVPYWRRAQQASADLFGFIERRAVRDIRASGAMAHKIIRLYTRCADSDANCRPG
jgi:hypothetical protein